MDGKKKINKTSTLCLIILIIPFFLVGGNLTINAHKNVNDYHTDLVYQDINKDIIMNNWLEKSKLIASDTSTYDYFGVSVSLYDTYAIVGARDDDGEKGSAYVFKRSYTTWSEEEKLTASDGAPGDWFGISVSVFGDYIFVGADADDNSNGVNAGSVYVFKRSGSVWNEEAKLLASDGAANDYFGRSVTIEGDYAIIGAYYDDNITGSAYVFKLVNGNWVEESKLIASDRQDGDYFGITNQINEDYAIVGAYREDNINGINAGSVYVFKHTGTTWTQETKLLASDGVAEDRFGIEVSMDRDFLIIGSYYDDSKTGSAYIFKKIDGSWIEKQKLTASDCRINNYFGRSVSIDGNNAIVGACGNYNQVGSAYLFKYNGECWIEEEKLTASDGKTDDSFAYQLQLDGNYAILGAYMDDNGIEIDAGSAYIFEQMSADLSCVGSLNWLDVKPGEKVIGNFQVINEGLPSSLLGWEIIEKPYWGTWVFKPEIGHDLTPEASPFAVYAEVIVPDSQETKFTGEIHIVNSQDPNDYCIIPVYLKTPIKRLFVYSEVFKFLQKFIQTSLISIFFNLNQKAY